MNRREDATCERCGAKFRPSAWRRYERRQRHCSRSCGALARKYSNKKKCQHCGLEFTGKNQRLFCSSKCANKVRDDRKRAVRLAAGVACSAGGCTGIAMQMRLCDIHYAHRRSKNLGKCSVESCSREQKSRGMCTGHRMQVLSGLPITPLRERLKEGDRWENEQGYVLVVHNGIARLEHRVAMEMAIGRKLKSKETVHHKNGVRSDNRLDNLELWASNHPPGQRIEDLVSWAQQILGTYGEHVAHS